MKQKQKDKNSMTEDEFFDDGRNKDFNQDSEQLKNYKNFFRHLLSGDVDMDNEFADELD